MLKEIGIGGREEGHSIRYSIEIADIFQHADGRHEHFSRYRVWIASTYIYIPIY